MKLENIELKGFYLKLTLGGAFFLWLAAALYAVADEPPTSTAQSSELTKESPQKVIKLELEDISGSERAKESPEPAGMKLEMGEEGESVKFFQLPRPAVNIEARDVPGDSGNNIEVTWQKSPDDGEGLDNVIGYRILRSNDPFGEWDEAGTVKPGKPVFRDRFDNPLDAISKDWYYLVETLSEGGPVRSEVFGPVSAEASWFNPSRLNVMLLLIIVIILIFAFLNIARRESESLYVRKIPGIDAIEEAIGRATEMGRPILYVPGISDMTNIQTIASMLILGKVAEKVAEYQAKIIVPNIIPFVREVAADVVRKGFFNAGFPDAFNPDSVPYLSQEQFAFTAGVTGIMLREKPAANLYLGNFFAESLILAETGFAAKAIQVAGTAEVTQIPFFIAACDYTLIGEELYAASAYLSKEPKALSTLKASDWAKVAFVGLILLGVIFESFGYSGFSEFFRIGGGPIH
ncbi:MAG: hypothetical protein Kow0090_04810 [Myxococcota bacterium]